MKHFRRGLFVVALAATFASAQNTPQPGQDLSFQLMRAGPLNAGAYLRPMIEGFTADMNSAVFHAAKPYSFLGFSLSLRHISTETSDADRMYDLVTPPVIDVRTSSGVRRLVRGTDYAAVVPAAPTTAGDIQDRVLRINPQSPSYAAYTLSHAGNDALLRIPRGYSTPSIPLVVPQLTVGLPLGFEAMVRFIPTMKALEVGDAGMCSYLGYGARYDLGQWLPFLPVDLAIHFATQTMKFKSESERDIFTARGSAFGVEIGKHIWLFNVYAAYQSETSSVTLHQINGTYATFDDVANPFTIPEQTFSGKNTSRVMVGGSLQVLILQISAEYTFAPTPVGALGIGFSVPD